MNSFIIDTNVAIAANGQSPQASPACQLACIKVLLSARDGIISIDNNDHIMSEYRKHLHTRGQPGTGDEFMCWLFQNQCVPSRCEQVAVPQDDNNDFTHFPTDRALSSFDPSDRKFVAVACASALQPIIYNAVDSDWQEHKHAFTHNNIHIHELCPSCLKSVPTTEKDT